MAAGETLLSRRGLRALGLFVGVLISLTQLPGPVQAQGEPAASAGSGQSPDGDGDGDASGGDADTSAGDTGDRASEAPTPAGGRSNNIQEVIQVEGARTTGFKEVPISVTSFGASDIQNLRIQNVADLSAYTPNLEINTSFAASNPTLFIRGVGLKDYNSNSTGAVAIWQDGIMMNSPAAQLFSLYDIENIEVLRGPVGGVGGRNASAGQIRINSFRPNGEWTADGSFSAGNMNLLQFEGALGFPIFPDFFNDMLSARVAFTTEFRDGYTNNVCSNWAPEQYGFLPSSEPATVGFYNELDAFDRDIRRPNGTAPNNSFIYRNLEAVERNNSTPGQVRINITTVEGSTIGLPAGPTEVGLQKDQLLIAPDGVCLLNNTGGVVTQRGAQGRPGRPPPPPAGTWQPQRNVLTLDDFQGLQKTYNNIEYYAGRAQLLFEPLDRLSFLANFHWGANRGDAFHVQPLGARPRPASAAPGEVITESPGYFQKDNSSDFTEIEVPSPPFETPVPRSSLVADAAGNGQGLGGGNVFNGYYSDDGKEKLDLMGASLDATYEADMARVVYIGGWESNSRDILDEGGGCPCYDLKSIIFDETWQFSNDFRVMGGTYGFDWTFGFFQLHEDLKSNNRFPSSIKFELDQDYAQITDAYNVGFDMHYDFLEDGALPWLYQISLDGGFRYNWEIKEFTLGTKFKKVESNAEKTTIPTEMVDASWDAPTGEVTISILPIENARIYGKFTRGFKAGHFNAGLTIQPVAGSEADDEARQSLDPVEPETVDSVEVGFKSSWIEDRLELSGAFFRYWYTDLQVFDIVNEFGAIPTQQLLNSDADVMGAELEFTVRPLDGLLLQAGLGWLDSKFRDFTVTKQTVAPSGVGPSEGEVSDFSYKGNPLIAAPKWSLSGYAEYELPLYRWGSLVPSFDFSFKSRTYLDPTKAELISQEPYWLFGARLAYRTPNGAIEVAAWVQNFLDQRYKIDAFDFARQFGQINEVWAEPRTFGVTISYAF